MRLIDADALNIRSYCRWFDDPDDIRVVERMIREAPAITPPPNAPLSLEELREMDGEPVYVTSSIGEQPMWYIVDVEEHELKSPWDRITLEEWDEGYPYRAYRRKPEEGTV